MATLLDFWPGDLWPGYAVSGLVAGVVGAADILTRYKDNPWSAIRTPAALGYVVANTCFGVAAFWCAMVLQVVKVEGVGRGPEAGLSVELLRSALLVGFGSIFILRAVAFKLSIGGKDTDVGPSTIVDSLLRACDQQIDRTEAIRKDRMIRKLMDGLSFKRAAVFIPNYCLAIVQDDTERAERFGALVTSIAKYESPDAAADPDAERAFLLGGALIKVFGYEFAARVIEGFRARLRAEQAAPRQALVAATGPGANGPGAASLAQAATPAAPAGVVGPVEGDIAATRGRAAPAQAAQEGDIAVTRTAPIPAPPPPVRPQEPRP